MHTPIRTAVLSIVYGALLLACNSGEEAVKKSENEVLAIHDEVMPKIDDILKLKKQLKQRITSLDSLKASGSASATLRTDEEKEQATRLVTDLAIADSLMMSWMSHYNGDTLSKISSEEALNYLAAQKDQITDVKKRVTTSIEQSRQFLGKP
ncbi:MULTISPECIES: viral A-type inclusion protein [unclassified Spirosoma]|uniref:viral A-type inclusion protein n=1 Tax=unclassified Spirosoma TaxID=2621999 RepID=UPI000961895B|nr:MULTISPECIES: viral A-type inclusion protein [unclassified Spirosoma]MBN8821188.1 viral A-type inclusion protein [Spirosoma sp.]OJW79182.1 MAG: viral A-type inclusion protein [Spirosoma sp. 48-14]